MNMLHFLMKLFKRNMYHREMGRWVWSKQEGLAPLLGRGESHSLRGEKQNLVQMATQQNLVQMATQDGA